MVRFHVRHREIHLEIDLADLPQACCNPGQLNQVLLNLLMNAIQAVGEGATIRVSTHLEPDGRAFRYEVADDGPGIPDSVLGKIFDPFFTTKPQGVGTGLGLWITYNIVQEHGGQIEVITRPGEGTTFRVTLPLNGPTLPIADTTDPASSGITGDATTHPNPPPQGGREPEDRSSALTPFSLVGEGRGGGKAGRADSRVHSSDDVRSPRRPGSWSRFPAGSGGSGRSRSSARSA